ncbi:hypothetical protein KUCAC02_024778, partial [Chaenocephalus aceratus]
TPAMIGCSFVVDREYFGEIGLLDPGMEVYGGENIELGMRPSGTALKSQRTSSAYWNEICLKDPTPLFHVVPTFISKKIPRWLQQHRVSAASQKALERRIGLRFQIAADPFKSLSLFNRLAPRPHRAHGE